MFASPCSLRSTQCAALIALATAAGIMRVEVAEARSSDSRTTKPETNLATRIELPRSAQTARFEVAFDAVAPWLALFQVAAQLSAESPAAIAAPLSSTAPAAPLPFPPRLCCGPTARQHSYPFAVGPPARDHAFQPLAAGTYVPGDSAARGLLVRLVSRVAPLDEGSSLARATRRFDLSAATAGSPIENGIEPCALTQATSPIAARSSTARPRGQRPFRATFA